MIPVFAAGPGKPFCASFQDAIREHMIASIPKRRQEHPSNMANSGKAARAAEWRASLEPEVLRLMATGMSRIDVARQIGVSDNTIVRIVKEAAARDNASGQGRAA